MPRVLILTFSDVARDPRVRRQIAALADEHEVISAGLGSGAGGTAHIALDAAIPRRGIAGRALAAARLAAGRHEAKYWSHPLVRAAETLLRQVAPDVVIANDVDTLPFALTFSARVIFDAHEYKPREFENLARFRLFQRYYRYLWRTYVPQAHAVTTVSHGLAAEFRRDVGVDPTVITNAAPFVDLKPSALRADGVIRMIHHGYAIPSRKLENMVDTMRELDDRFVLDFMLVESEAGYIQKLRNRAARDERIRFIPPVALPDIVAATNAYDLGLFLLEPANFNYRHALPNKLFEFVQARLGVAIGPTPDMADVVRQHGLGIIADDFTPAAMARALRTLTPARVAAFKQRAHESAHELSANRDAERLRRLVDTVARG